MTILEIISKIYISWEGGKNGKKSSPLKVSNFQRIQYSVKDHSRELDFVTQGDARIENLKVWKYPATCSKENLCNGRWWVHYHFENWRCYIVFFSLPKFALYSVQRNFMASKSFKVGFSMNIKMMLFHQFVTRLHFEFSLSSVFALSSHLLYPPMSNTACYCKIVKSNTAFPPFVFFIGKLFSGKLNQTLFRSCWKIKKRNGGKSLLDGSGFQLYDLFPSGILVTPN